MSTITWLHLSDLHFREQHAWDEDIVLRALLKDVQECMDEHGLVPDMILVSGDIAFSGDPAEYDIARAFFDGLLHVTNLEKERLLVVPGNHDVNRKAVSQLARIGATSLQNRQAVNEIIADVLDRRVMLRRFDNFASFVRDYFDGHIPFDDEHYFYVRSLKLAGRRVAVLGLNSAWLAYGGHEESGYLALGERQVRQALDLCHDAELRIALLHHPFEWLHDFDIHSCKPLLMDSCAFILSGHLHCPELLYQQTPDASVMTVAAGACYDGRKHENRYNLVRLDLQARQGIVFLRVWSDRGSGFWTKDEKTYKKVKDGKFIFLFDDYLISPSIPETWSDLGKGGWTGDSLQEIETRFSRDTDRALRQIRPLIPGISDSLPREEVAGIEDQLQNGKPVVLTGNAGTGKSGIGAKLARSARARDIVVLLLDARRVGRIENEAELRQYFDLKGLIHSAIERIGRYKGCRFIIDQLDNIAGSASATLLVDLAIECCRFEGVEVVVISRQQETHEVRLVQRLIDERFVELVSDPLSQSKAARVLDQLGISQPSADLVALGQNLLNLELIGQIKQEQPDADFSALMDEVDLWERHIQALLEREQIASSPESAERIVADAVELARAGLNSEDRTFCVSYPVSRSHRRLISWGMIVCADGRVYRFRHEKLQDFLYGWDATQRNAMPATVLNEIDVHRTRNVLVWMDRIYSQRSPRLHGQFLREALNV